MGENCHDLYQCVLELETSERKYHEQLNYLSDLYILHLKTCVTLGEEMEQMLLTKLRDVSELSTKLAVKLRERLTVWDEDCSLISDVFLKDPDFWDLYGYFCLNIDSAISKYDEKMTSPDFAALVTLKQGLDNPSLRELILLPVERLKKYKEFFELFLEKTVSADFIFSHPDFSAVMECKKKVEKMIPPRLSEIMERKQVEEFNRIESLLGSLSQEFFSYISLLHEEPASAKPWRKRPIKKSFNRSKGDGVKGSAPERFDIGGRKYETGDLAPDILNAMRKQEEIDILSGMSSPKRGASRASPGEHFVASVSKVKVRWENEVHTYNLYLFKQCLVFSKIRNKTMKISRIVKLKQLWLSEYKDVMGFGHVEKEGNAFLGSWLGSELDSELLHRVIFSFPNKDTRLHWYILLQRYIQWASTHKAGSRPGVIKVYFKKSDSSLSVPGDTLWQGMSCQELQIEPTRTVGHVIEEAVKICQMKDNAYTLSFIILHDRKIVYEEQLIWMEMPLIIQSEVKAMVPDPRNTQMIFFLQENGSSGDTSSGTSSPTPSNKLNTVVTFFRGRANTATGYRPTPASQLLTPALKSSANTMFGASLSEFMGEDPDTVPPPLLDLMVYIFNHCYNCEGIFRVPGSLVVQRALEKRLEAGEKVEWCVEELEDKFYLPNVASSLFKYYLRSLPGGLVPRHLFPQLEEWRAGLEKEEDREESVCRMKEILSHVPAPNLTLLRYTLHILKRITDFSTVNLMDVKVLSTCIGPSLVTWPEDASALSILADQYRRQTPCTVTMFLVEEVVEMAGRAAPHALERRAVVEEDVKSRVSRVDEVESSDEEDTNSVWILMRSSIKEQLLPLQDNGPVSKESNSGQVSPVVITLTTQDGGFCGEIGASSTSGKLPEDEPGKVPEDEPGTIV